MKKKQLKKRIKKRRRRRRKMISQRELFSYPHTWSQFIPEHRNLKDSLLQCDYCKSLNRQKFELSYSLSLILSLSLLSFCLFLPPCFLLIFFCNSVCLCSSGWPWYLTTYDRLASLTLQQLFCLSLFSAEILDMHSDFSKPLEGLMCILSHPLKLNRCCAFIHTI